MGRRVQFTMEIGLFSFKYVRMFESNRGSARQGEVFSGMSLSPGRPIAYLWAALSYGKAFTPLLILPGLFATACAGPIIIGIV